MQKAILWLEDSEDWRKALFICECKSVVDTEGIRLVQAADARLNAKC